MFGVCERSVTSMSVSPVRIQSSERVAGVVVEIQHGDAGTSRWIGRRWPARVPSTTRCPAPSAASTATAATMSDPRRACTRRAASIPDAGARGGRRHAGRGFLPPPRRAKVDDDVLHALVAIVGILGRALADHALQLRRRIGRRARRRRQRRHRIGQDGVQRVERALALERRTRRQHLVEHDAKREDVGAVVDAIAARLFRRHVGRGADDQAGRRVRTRRTDRRRVRRDASPRASPDRSR